MGENIITVLNDTPAEWYALVQGEQEMYKAANGKYKFQAKDSYALNCEIHEYVTPEGEAGYIVYEYKEVDGVTYKKATGKGPELHRYHDWREQVAPGK